VRKTRRAALRVRLVHWNRAEAEHGAALIRAAGYDVVCEALTPARLRALRKDPPAALVVDLSRLPMQGRDMGIALRHYKRTRHVPLVFVGGEPGKVARVKQHLPDAVYASWRGIRGALRRAVTRPPLAPVAAPSLLAGYSGTPLPRKLGIKRDSLVVLVGAPRDFESTLGELPEGAVLRRRAAGRPDLAVWFVTSRRELVSRIRALGELVGGGGLWIAWPKRASGRESDLTQNVVREVGLAAGLVDYKVCALDSTWSGLKFTRRKLRR
jgi:hypothetical protein